MSECNQFWRMYHLKNERQKWDGKEVKDLPQGYIFFVKLDVYDLLSKFSNVNAYEETDLDEIKNYIIPVTLRYEGNDITGYLAKMVLVAEYGSTGYYIKIRLALKYGLCANNFGQFVQLTNSTAREMIQYAEKNCTWFHNKSGIRNDYKKMRHIVFRLW